MGLWRRRFRKEAATRCQSLMENQGQSHRQTCCPSAGKPTAPGFMHSFKRIQVLISLGGAVSGRQALKTGGVQAVPMLEKRQRGRRRFRCPLRGPDSVPSGCGCWAEEGERGVPLPDSGVVFVCVAQRSRWSACSAPPRALQLLS